MTHLSEKRCRMVSQDETGMSGDDLTHYIAQLNSSWQVLGANYLSRVFNFPTHDDAVDFVEEISEISMDEGHFPDTILSYGEVKIVINTSEVDGVHENDFILAAKIERRSNKLFKSE